MYASERHEVIAGMVRQRGRVSVTDVAGEFGVTTETVRRDLAQLERVGLLRRVHGGAVPVTALTVVEPGVAERDSTQAEAKDSIARAAAAMLPGDGGSILLDAGTTTGRLAALLPLDRRLVVVTNSVPIASRVSGSGALRLHLLGGRVRGTTRAAVGEETVAALRNLRVDTAFVGTNALTCDRGLTTPHHEEAAVKRGMVAAGRQVVVLADSSKIGAEHLIRFAEIGDIDVLVTDDAVDDADVTALEAGGVAVVVA